MGARRPPPSPHTHRVASYLNFLHHLLAEGADLSRTSNDHVVQTLVLAGHPIEGVALIVDVSIEVCLPEK